MLVKVKNPECARKRADKYLREAFGISFKELIRRAKIYFEKHPDEWDKAWSEVERTIPKDENGVYQLDQRIH